MNSDGEWRIRIEGRTAAQGPALDRLGDDLGQA